MNILLAKKLKDAGFIETFTWTKDPYGEIVPNPSLSELIEACGMEFASLNYMSAPRWFAFRKSSVLAGKNVTGEIIAFEGTTPEEAVANLWLALNNNAND